MQCPFILPTEVRLRKGKAIGSEEGKELGNGLRYEQRKETKQGLYCVKVKGKFVPVLN
jgi:hypothetical protein